MAERPVFIPSPNDDGLVKELYFQLVWNPGFAPSQKKKNVDSLHNAAATAGYAPLLEVSTKSDEKVGQHLSAFNLKVHTDELGYMPLEMAFQGSKVFEKGGPFQDLYLVKDAREAKRDSRLHESGLLKGFKFGDIWFPLRPITAFYDWLYITALYKHRDWLKKNMLHYAGFTDIEFNPEKSMNCQARSCALLVTLIKNDWLDEVVSSPAAFIKLLSDHQYKPSNAHRIESLFKS